MFVSVYGCLRVFIGVYGFLRAPIGVYRFLGFEYSWVSNRLWVFVGIIGVDGYLWVSGCL